MASGALDNREKGHLYSVVLLNYMSELCLWRHICSLKVEIQLVSDSINMLASVMTKIKYATVIHT